MPGQPDSLESRMQADLSVRMQSLHDQQMSRMQQHLSDSDAAMSSAAASMQYSASQVMDSVLTPGAYTQYENTMMRRQLGRNIGAAGVGIAGAGLGLAATFAMPMAAGLLVGGVVSAGIDRFMVRPVQARMQQVARTEDYLEASSYRYVRPWDSRSPLGAGFNFSEQSDVARFMRNLSPKKYMAQDDLHSLLQNFTEGDLFEGTRNVKQFTEKFEKLVDSVKTSAKLLGSSFQTVSKMMGEYQRMGLNAGNFDLFSAQMRQVASFSGQSTDAVIGQVLSGASAAVSGTSVNPENAVNRRSYNTALLGIEFSLGKDESMKQLMRNLPGGKEAAGEAATRSMEYLFSNQQFGAISAAFYDYDPASRAFKFRPERASQIKSMDDLSTMASRSIGKMDLVGQQLFMRRYPEMALENFSGRQGSEAAMAMLRAVSGNNDPVSAATYLGLDPTNAQLLVGTLNAYSQYGGYANMQLSRGAFQSYVQGRLIAQTPTIGQRWSSMWDRFGNAVYGDAAQSATDWGVQAGLAIDRLTGMPVPINQFVPNGAMNLGGTDLAGIEKRLHDSFMDAKGIDTELERRRKETIFSRPFRGIRDNAQLAQNANVRAHFEYLLPERALEMDNLKIGSLQHEDLKGMLSAVRSRSKDAAIHYNTALQKLAQGGLAESDRYGYQTVVDNYEGGGLGRFSGYSVLGFDDRRSTETSQYTRVTGIHPSEARMSDLTSTIDSMRKQLNQDYDSFRKGNDYNDLTRSISRSSLAPEVKKQVTAALADGDFATLEKMRSNDPNVRALLEQNGKAYATVSDVLTRSGTIDKLVSGSAELKQYGLFASFGYKSIFEFYAGEKVAGADQALKDATDLYQGIGKGTIPLNLSERTKNMESLVRSYGEGLAPQRVLAADIQKFVLSSPEWAQRIYQLDDQGRPVGVTGDYQKQFTDFMLQMMSSPSDAAGGSSSSLGNSLDEHLVNFKKMTDTLTGEIAVMKEKLAFLGVDG